MISGFSADSFKTNRVFKLGSGFKVGSGFKAGSGFSRGSSGSGGKKPRKFNGAKVFGKIFAYFIAFLFLVVVSFFSGFFGGWLNNYLKKTESGGVVYNSGGDGPAGVEVNADDGFSVEALVAKIMPSVVGVVAPIRRQSSSWGKFGDDDFPFFPFPFSNRSGSFCAGGRKLPDNGNFGSGFFVSVDKDVYVVTNHHVVKDFIEGSPSNDPAKNSIYIVLKNDISNLKSANVVGYDVDLDVAVLKPVSNNFNVACLEFVEPKSVRVGEVAVAIGNPISLKESTVTLGIVSCLRKIHFDSGAEVPVVQTDAAINHGNSGGPLVNRRGKVMGINTCKLAGSQSEGIAFAVEGSVIREKVFEIVRNGTKNSGSAYPGLGVIVCDDDSYLSKYFGVVISNVAKDSPADRAGLKVGDVIAAIDEVRVKSFAEWQQELRKKKPGTEVVLSIIRRGSVLKVKVAVE